MPHRINAGMSKDRFVFIVAVLSWIMETDRWIQSLQLGHRQPDDLSSTVRRQKSPEAVQEDYSEKNNIP